MKKIFYFFIAGSMFLLGGCKKFLDQKPLAEVGVNQFYKSKYDIDAAMAGMYAGFQQQMVGESQYKERYNFWGDYRSDNFERFLSYTTTTVSEITLNGITPDNDFADWSGLYNVIGRANNLIKYAPPVIDNDVTVNQEYIDKTLAESYSMRALSYFYIVRLWGDAPIWTEPFESLQTDAEKPREPVAKIFDEIIIKDLEKAYELTAKNKTAVVYNISEGAICAILADVYMWRKDYTNAIKWITNLFKAKGPTGKVYTGASAANLQASETWKNIFTDPAKSIEAIWSLHWDFETNACACMEISWTNNNKQVVIDEDLWANWFLPYMSATPPPDIRPRQTLDVFTRYPNESNRDRFVKWYASPVNQVAPTNSTDLATFYSQEKSVYLPMYRLADIYLLYAEALNGNADLAGALKYLNFVRKRAGIAEYDVADPAVATQADMQNAILQERQYELLGEGKRWFDLVRTDKVIEIMDPILKRRQIEAGSEPIGFSDPRKILWPISRNVLNSNRKLTQNPGYGG